jgi:hypothetical protein
MCLEERLRHREGAWSAPGFTSARHRVRAIFFSDHAPGSSSDSPVVWHTAAAASSYEKGHAGLYLTTAPNRIAGWFIR